METYETLTHPLAALYGRKQLLQVDADQSIEEVFADVVTAIGGAKALHRAKPKAAKGVEEQTARPKGAAGVFAPTGVVQNWAGRGTDPSFQKQTDDFMAAGRMANDPLAFPEKSDLPDDYVFALGWKRRKRYYRMPHDERGPIEPVLEEFDKAQVLGAMWRKTDRAIVGTFLVPGQVLVGHLLFLPSTMIGQNVVKLTLVSRSWRGGKPLATVIHQSIHVQELR